MATGTVLGIAVRNRALGPTGPLTEVDEATATANGGIEPNHNVTTKRGITFIAKDRWEAATVELDAPHLPWHTRRANVLVDGLDLASLIGKTIRIGETIVVTVNGETEPCELMDKLHPGLRAALTPDCRGGVYGTVIEDGKMRVGDTIFTQE
jgi:MOSC domain-containing protein YiiM